MRKVFLLLLVTSLAILIFSCSSQKPPDNNAQVQPGKPDLTQGPATTGKPTSGGWEVQWDNHLKEAKREGRVVVYGAFGLAQARDPVIKGFREKFGIELEMTIARGPELTNKLITERRAGLYLADVYMGGAQSIFYDLIPRDMLDPIEPYLILPEVKDPSAWLGGSLPLWESKRAALASLANITSYMAINTTLIKQEELTSYKDLLQPRLKGKIVLADPTSPGAGRSWITSAIDFMGTDYVREFIKQEPVLTRDFRLPTEWLVRGKSIVGIGVDSGGIRSAIKDGAPLMMLPVLKEGVIVGAGGGHVAVVNQHPHQNGTIVFTNWILSKEGQTLLSRTIGMASRRVDIPTDHLEASMIANPTMKLVWEDEDYIKLENKKMEFAREVFAPLLR